MEWIKLNNFEWILKGDRYSFIRVWKIGLSSLERKKRGIGVWGFTARIGRNGEEIKKYFKSLPAALSFTENWIKENSI